MLSTFITTLQTMLAPVAGSLTGDNKLAENDAPPRYVFVRKGFRSTGPTSVSRNPRSLGDRLYALDVHCWGQDEDEADRLSLALETALRTDAQGRNYEVTDAKFVPLNDSHNGVVCVVSLTLRLTTPMVRLEAGAPDDELPTVAIESVEVETPAGTPGDDELEPGD